MQHVRPLTAAFRFACVLAISFVIVLSTGMSVSAQIDENPGDTPTIKSSFDSKKWQFSFGGLLMSGKVSTALLPVTEEFGDMNPIESPYGFGLGIDYNLSPSMRLFFDGNFYTYRKQVGVAGEYSESFWVYEMTDYESHYIGPFEEDAYFYMQTTGLRVGVKYGILSKGMRPWAGAGFGFYAWKADYMTADRTKTWGGDSGTIAGPTFLLGVDFILGRDSKSPIVVTLYGDFASPVANETITDLFQDGWTWENTTGNHVMGPYRFGLSIGFMH
ncbi:MAG: hypothetical protein AB1483_08975 [Candidatus Zixiibacteriota bacterium]